MSALRFTLVLLFAGTYGGLTAHKEGASWDSPFSIILVAVIVGWMAVSQLLLRFIDNRNRSRKIQGLAGFLVLLVSLFAIEYLVFRLRREFGLAMDASASFLRDSAWLVIFPVVVYHGATKKRARQPSHPTPTGRRG